MKKWFRNATNGDLLNLILFVLLARFMFHWARYGSLNTQGVIALYQRIIYFFYSGDWLIIFFIPFFIPVIAFFVLPGVLVILFFKAVSSKASKIEDENAQEREEYLSQNPEQY